MAILWDTHLHTNFSTDSNTPLTSQLSQGEQMGLNGVCVTDHMDYEFPATELDHPVEGIPFCFDWSSYVKAVREAAGQSPLTIYTGVECGLQTTETVIQKNRKLRQQPELDYMIGSLHLVDQKDPYYPSFWEGRDPRACIMQYFESLYENLRCFHEFDSLGHLDYIVRYAPQDFQYDPKSYEDILDAILTYLVQKDIALEINSSGWKTKGRCQNPHPDILTRYRERGGELITVGSDAHVPDYVAYRFDQVCEEMKKAGLCQYVVYQKHKPVFYDLH